MARTVVKICGLTRLEDARAALSAGADWLGFVLKGESPRRVEPALARRILASLDGATGVAVLVGPTPEEALRLAGEAGAVRVQLHGVDPLGWPADFPLPASFSVPVADDGALMTPLPDPRHVVLLDTAHATRAGGTGRTFPWFVAATVATQFRVMVAGGLDADNVAEMLAQVHPFGVDASSRLEVAPGIKDPERLRRFVAAVRSHDATQPA